MSFPLGKIACRRPCGLKEKQLASPSGNNTSHCGRPLLPFLAGRMQGEMWQLERGRNPTYPSVSNSSATEAQRGKLCGSEQQSLLCIADLICALQIFSIEYLKINLFVISYALLRLWTYLITMNIICSLHVYNYVKFHLHAWVYTEP